MSHSTPKAVSYSLICRQYQQAQNKASNHHESIWGKLARDETCGSQKLDQVTEFPWQTKDLKELHLPRKMQGEVFLRGRPGSRWEGFVPLLGPAHFTPGPQKHLLRYTCMPHGAPVPRGSGIFPVSPAQDTIFLVSTCPSFFMGLGASPFLAQQGATVSYILSHWSYPGCSHCPPHIVVARWGNSCRGVWGVNTGGIIAGQAGWE